jgi:hypothetical protein
MPLTSPRPDLSKILGQPVACFTDPRGGRHYLVDGKEIVKLPCPTDYKKLQQDEIELFTRMKEKIT